jgi:hypothetical protein
MEVSAAECSLCLLGAACSVKPPLLILNLNLSWPEPYIYMVYTLYSNTAIQGIIGREITEYTVIYGVYMRFWPILVLIR